MCVCGGVHLSAVPTEARRQRWISRRWSYIQLWVAPYGHWKVIYLQMSHLSSPRLTDCWSLDVVVVNSRLLSLHLSTCLLSTFPLLCAYLHALTSFVLLFLFPHSEMPMIEDWNFCINSTHFFCFISFFLPNCSESFLSLSLHILFELL